MLIRPAFFEQVIGKASNVFSTDWIIIAAIIAFGIVPGLFALHSRLEPDPGSSTLRLRPDGATVPSASQGTMTAAEFFSPMDQESSPSLPNHPSNEPDTTQENHPSVWAAPMQIGAGTAEILGGNQPAE